MNSKSQQKEQVDVFPCTEEIKRMISNFPSEVTANNDKEVKKAYKNLSLYVQEKVDSREKHHKVYACQGFLSPLREKVKRYYHINKNLFLYYFNVYNTVVPVLADYEKDIPFFEWVINQFFIGQDQLDLPIRLRFVKMILNLTKRPDVEMKLYDKVKNIDVLFKFVVFDLIDSAWIMSPFWIWSIKTIVTFQLKYNVYNVLSYHFLFNLICVVVTCVYSSDISKKSEATEVNRSNVKQYTSDVIELFDLMISNLNVRPAYMLQKYLLVVIIVSRCMNEPNILDIVLQKKTSFQLELKVKLFDVVGFSKELENVIKSLRESLWSEDNILNNINITTLASKEDYIAYQQRMNAFLERRMVVSRQFLTDIDFQKNMVGAVSNIFFRDKSNYDINKQIMFISFFKSLFKINIASLENLFTIIMQTLFCWNEHFIFEWELIFEFFESRREMFKKHRFYFTYLYQLAVMFNEGNYHGDTKLFEYHFMQWEDLPNDELIQKLYIDFAFKAPYMMITELPKQLEQSKKVCYDDKTNKYFFNKIASVYDNDASSDKVNEAIVKYFLPFFDVVHGNKLLVKEWENSVFTIVTKINDDNVELLSKVFDYLKCKVQQTKFVSVGFLGKLIHHSWTNYHINTLHQVNSTVECFIDTVHLKINEFDLENMSKHVKHILKLVRKFSYTFNNEIICGPIQQRKNMSIWKINYKFTYEQHETSQFVVFTHQKLFGLFIAVLSQNKLNAEIKTKLLQYIHELFCKNPFFLVNINLNDFYSYTLSTIASANVDKTGKDLELVLSLVNDLAYIIPTTYCHPAHKIPPYYFPTQDFPGKKDIKRRCIESLITLSVSVLEHIRKAASQSPQVPQSELVLVEFNGGVVDCGDSEELTAFYSTTLPDDNVQPKVNAHWKYVAKLLDCISFQLHSLFNYGAYDVNSKYRNTYNPYTLFKYLQTKTVIKSSSIREQEIRVILDSLIRRLLYPIRELLTKEESVHVDLLTFSFYKLFYHNLELFSVFNDVALQIFHFLISLSWSKQLHEVNFKYTNIFPEIRKLTQVNSNFLAEPNLHLRIQINSLICSFAELSSNGEKLCDMLTGILNKNLNDADKTPKEVLQMFLNTLEWHVAIKRKRDAYYNSKTDESDNRDCSMSYQQSAETAFISDKHRAVLTKLNNKMKSKFDVLIYSPFSNSQMHLNLLKKDRTNENNYRTFNQLDKAINKFVCEEEENENEIVYEDDTIAGNDESTTRNKELGCFIENQEHMLNKGYQFQYLYKNDINEFLPLHDINAMLSISNLSVALNEVPVNFFCYVNLFYHCPSSSKNAYTNLFNLFISSLTGLNVRDVHTKLSNDSYLILPTQSNQMMISVYNSKESLEVIQQNKPRKVTSYSQLDKSVSVIWVDHSNHIDKPSYVASNEKLFVVTIYAFSSQYFTVETKVNNDNLYAPFILDKFQMLFQEVNVINSNETLKTLSNFLTKHIQLLCTIAIDQKLTSMVIRNNELWDKRYINSMYLPKEDNVYYRYTHINSKK